MNRSIIVAALILCAGLMQTAQAGNVVGPAQHSDVVAPEDYDSYSVTFRGSEVAQVRVKSYGKTFVKVGIIDTDGNIVAVDDDYTGNDCLLTWIPQQTAVYHIVIVNTATISNTYFVSTN